MWQTINFIITVSAWPVQCTIMLFLKIFNVPFDNTNAIVVRAIILGIQIWALINTIYMSWKQLEEVSKEDNK